MAKMGQEKKLTKSVGGKNDKKLARKKITKLVGKKNAKNGLEKQKNWLHKQKIFGSRLANENRRVKMKQNREILTKVKLPLCQKTKLKRVIKVNTDN